MKTGIDKKRIDELVAQVPDDAKDELLYAGFAVLARDMFYYLKEQNLLDDHLMFKNAVDAVRKDEVVLGMIEHFPEYKGLDTSDLPRNISENAAQGQLDMSPVLKPGVIHEWTVIPGERLFRRLSSDLHETICGPNGPYKTLKSTTFNRTIASSVAVAVAGAITAGSTLGYPLAVYAGILLSRFGLKQYCERPSTR